MATSANRCFVGNFRASHSLPSLFIYGATTKAQVRVETLFVVEMMMIKAGSLD